jgi:hypothetical protein
MAAMGLFFVLLVGILSPVADAAVGLMRLVWLGVGVLAFIAFAKMLD